MRAPAPPPGQSTALIKSEETSPPEVPFQNARKVEGEGIRAVFTCDHTST